MNVKSKIALIIVGVFLFCAGWFLQEINMYDRYNSFYAEGYKYGCRKTEWRYEPIILQYRYNKIKQDAVIEFLENKIKEDK